MFANKTHEKAHELLKERKFEEALEFFNRALSESPGHPDILSDRGVNYIHLGDKENALNDFEEAIEMQPDYGFRYAARAYARDYFGDTENAILDYEKALELDPEDAVSYNNLGLLQEKLGYKKQAEESFNRADELSKQENHLFELMEDLENASESSFTEDNPKFEHQMIDPNEIREQNISSFREFSKIFTSKKQFGEFLRFLKNGLKIK
jgi:tetratricopeptide (TPR) repeat protein